jgi:hypothetical protein
VERVRELMLTATRRLCGMSRRISTVSQVPIEEHSTVWRISMISSVSAPYARIKCQQFYQTIVNKTYIIVQILAEFRWTTLGGAAGFRV